MSEFLFHQTCLWSAGWSLIPNQQYQDGRQVHQIMSEGLVHCSWHLLLQVGRGVLNNSQIHHEHYFPDLTMAMGVYRTQKQGSECECVCVCIWPCVCVCMCVCVFASVWQFLRKWRQNPTLWFWIIQIFQIALISATHVKQSHVLGVDM